MVKADREKSTVEAGKDLQDGVERLFKDSPIKEQVLALTHWPSFEQKQQKTKAKPPVSAPPHPLCGQISCIQARSQPLPLFLLPQHLKCFPLSGFSK